MRPPQPSATGPQLAPASAQVRGAQCVPLPVSTLPSGVKKEESGGTPTVTSVVASAPSSPGGKALSPLLPPQPISERSVIAAIKMPSRERIMDTSLTPMALSRAGLQQRREPVLQNRPPVVSPRAG